MSNTWKNENFFAAQTLKPKQRQAFEYKFLRSGIVEGPEANLLLVLFSYSNASVCKLEELAYYCNRSVRTIKRYLKSLESKGVIEKSYRAYKRLTIRIVDRFAQKHLTELKKAGGFGWVRLRQAIGNVNKKVRRAAYGPNMALSIEKETIKYNKENNQQILGLKRMPGSGFKTEQELQIEKDRQINQLIAMGLIKPK